jgi:hypothetical protein
VRELADAGRARLAEILGNLRGLIVGIADRFAHYHKATKIEAHHVGNAADALGFLDAPGRMLKREWAMFFLGAAVGGLLDGRTSHPAVVIALGLVAAVSLVILVSSRTPN